MKNQNKKPKFEIGSEVLLRTQQTGKIIGYLIYEGKWEYVVDTKGNYQEKEIFDKQEKEIERVINYPKVKYKPPYQIGHKLRGAEICGIRLAKDKFLYYVGLPDFMVNATSWEELPDPV